MMWSQFVTTSKLEDNKYIILVNIFDPKGKNIQNIDFKNRSRKLEVAICNLKFRTEK